MRILCYLAHTLDIEPKLWKLLKLMPRGRDLPPLFTRYPLTVRAMQFRLRSNRGRAANFRRLFGRLHTGGTRTLRRTEHRLARTAVWAGEESGREHVEAKTSFRSVMVLTLGAGPFIVMLLLPKLILT